MATTFLPGPLRISSEDRIQPCSTKGRNAGAGSRSPNNSPTSLKDIVPRSRKASTTWNPRSSNSDSSMLSTSGDKDSLVSLARRMPDGRAASATSPGPQQ